MLSLLLAAVTPPAGLREEVVLGDKQWFGIRHAQTTCGGSQTWGALGGQQDTWAGCQVGAGRCSVRGVLGDPLGDLCCSVQESISRSLVLGPLCHSPWLAPRRRGLPR